MSVDDDFKDGFPGNLLPFPEQAPGAKVIPFPPQPGPDGATPPMLVYERVSGFCLCETMAFEEATRACRCTKCGRRIEAFDALKKISRNWDSYARNLIAIKAETDAARRELANVKRQVVNLKAQAKRAGAKVAIDTEREHGPIVLEGWRCDRCCCFNGESKEQRTACRACGGKVKVRRG